MVGSTPLLGRKTYTGIEIPSDLAGAALPLKEQFIAG